MKRTEFIAILTPLVVAMRTDMDGPAWTVYFRALDDVSAPLLAAAVARAVKSSTFMPKPGELRTFAEEARQSILGAHPYAGCIECESSIGWRPRLDQPRTVERCGCFVRHQHALLSLGVGSTPVAALTAGVEG